MWGPVIGEVLQRRTLTQWQDSRVLEIGFRQGKLAALLAKLGATVHGLETQPAYVPAASAYAASKGVESRCNFEVADFFTLPSQYDLVVTKSVLYSIKEVARYRDWVTGMANVLVAGGEIMLIENGSGNSLVKFARKLSRSHRLHADCLLSNPVVLDIIGEKFDILGLKSYYAFAPLMPREIVSAFERRFLHVSFSKSAIFWLHGKKKE